jgi:hypothetical protein
MAATLGVTANPSLKHVGDGPRSAYQKGDANVWAAGRSKLNSTGMLDNLNEQGYVPGAVTASGKAGWGDEEQAGNHDDGDEPAMELYNRNHLKSTRHHAAAENPMFAGGDSNDEPNRDYLNDSDIEPADYHRMMTPPSQDENGGPGYGRGGLQR